MLLESFIDIDIKDANGKQQESQCENVLIVFYLFSLEVVFLLLFYSIVVARFLLLSRVHLCSSLREMYM